MGGGLHALPHTPYASVFGQEALLKQLGLAQQEMTTRQSLWESEKEEVAAEREREATERLMKEMEDMKRTHEQEYAELERQYKLQQEQQQSSSQNIKENEEMVGRLHEEKEKHRSEVAPPAPNPCCGLAPGAWFWP